MKKITNTYKEPIVISLLVPAPAHRVPDRTQMNLLMGKSVEVDDKAISPELVHMCKKGRVSIEDVVESPVKVIAQVKESRVEPPSDEPVEEEDIQALEHELLKEQNSQEG